MLTAKENSEYQINLQFYNEYFNKLGNALGTTVNHFNTAQKELGKIDKDVIKIAGEGTGYETIQFVPSLYSFYSCSKFVPFWFFL